MAKSEKIVLRHTPMELLDDLDKHLSDAFNLACEARDKAQDALSKINAISNALTGVRIQMQQHELAGLKK